MNMICPHCKKQNYNEKAIECAYCHQNMKEKPVAPVVVEQAPVQPVVQEISQPVVTVEQPVQPVKEKKPKKKANKKKVAKIIVGIVISLILIGVVVFIGCHEANYRYLTNISNDDPVSAMYGFERMTWYRDSAEQAEIHKGKVFEKAKKELENNQPFKAKSLLDAIPNYEGVDELRKEVNYQIGVSYFNAAKYPDSEEYFKKVEGYKDADKYLNSFANKLSGAFYVKTYTGPGNVEALIFYNGEVTIIQYPDSATFTYRIDESKGEYVLSATGAVVGDNVVKYDLLDQEVLCFIKNPKYDKDGRVSQFTANGVVFVRHDTTA